jgi:hypothetical protein
MVKIAAIAHRRAAVVVFDIAVPPRLATIPQCAAACNAAYRRSQ